MPAHLGQSMSSSSTPLGIPSTKESSARSRFFRTGIRAFLASPRLVPSLLLACAALSAPALFTGFFGDDHFFRAVFDGSPGLPEFKLAPHQSFEFFAEFDPAVRKARLDRGCMPWWSGPEMYICFMRPLSSLSHWADHMLFGEAAWPAHLHSVLWFLGTVLLAALLYRRLLPVPWVAGLAALMYGLDEAHGLSIAWLSARNGLLTTFFSLAVLLAHDHWRRSGRSWALPVSLVALGLGLASGEAAVGVAGFLFSYALFMDPAPLLRRMLALAPCGVVFLVWAFLYRHYGFGVKNTGTYADPLGDPLLFAFYAISHLPVLFISQFGLPDSTVFNFLSGPMAAAYWAAAVAGVAFFAWLLWPVLREHAQARFWALGMLLSAVPSAAVAPQDRLLGLAGTGVMALLALFIGRVAGQQPAFGLRRRVNRYAVPALLAIHVGLAALLLPVTSYFLTVLPELGTLKADAGVPKEDVENRTVVMVNAPSDVLNVAVLVRRSSLHQPVPKHCWLLTATNRGVRVKREGARTLLVSAEGGYLAKPWANRFREVSKEPMPAGCTVDLNGMRAEVVESLEDGRPYRVRFTFERDLEDSEYSFLCWRDNDFFPFAPPRTGEEEVIPGLDLSGVLPELFGERDAESMLSARPAHDMRAENADSSH